MCVDQTLIVGADLLRVPTMTTPKVGHGDLSFHADLLLGMDNDQPHDQDGIPQADDQPHLRLPHDQPHGIRGLPVVWDDAPPSYDDHDEQRFFKVKRQYCFGCKWFKDPRLHSFDQCWEEYWRSDFHRQERQLRIQVRVATKKKRMIRMSRMAAGKVWISNSDGVTFLMKKEHLQYL